MTDIEKLIQWISDNPLSSIILLILVCSALYGLHKIRERY